MTKSALESSDIFEEHLVCIIIAQRVTFLMMPLEIAWAMTVSWWAGDFLCRLCSFFRIFGLFLSSNIVVCISIDRFLAILRPFSVRGSSRRIKWMLAVAWGMAVLLSLPQCFVFSLKFHPDYDWYGQCVTYGTFDSRMQEFFYFFLGMIFLYIVPLIIIIVTYGGIICHLHRKDVRWTRDEEVDQPSPTSQPQQPDMDSSLKEQHPPTKIKRFSMASLRMSTRIPASLRATTTATTTVTTTTTTASNSPLGTRKLKVPIEADQDTLPNSRKHSAVSTPIVIRRSNPGMIGKAKLNTIKITMTLVGVFLACWTPYYVLCIWFWVAPESYNQIDYRIQKFLFLYACTNSCANPLIYGAFSTNGAGIFTNKDRTPARRRWFSHKFRRDNGDDRQRASSASVVLHRDKARSIGLTRLQRNHDSEVMPARLPYRFSMAGRKSDAGTDQESSCNNTLNLDESKSKSPRSVVLTQKFRLLDMKNNLKRYHDRTPINVTVNVQVNGFRLSDIAMQTEIEKHRKADSSSNNSQEDVIVIRELKDLSENSETSQNATNV